jgi:hypothetical protein
MVAHLVYKSVLREKTSLGHTIPVRIPSISNFHPILITLALFRSNYGSHEARRQLCSSYDLFVADERILVLLPKLLGESHNGDLMAVCQNISTGT